MEILVHRWIAGHQELHAPWTASLLTSERGVPTQTTKNAAQGASSTAEKVSKDWGKATGQQDTEGKSWNSRVSTQATTGEFIQAAVTAGMLVDCGGGQQGKESGEHQL